MSNLNELINKEIIKLENGDDWGFISGKMRAKLGDVAVDDVLNEIRQSLKDISYKSIEAVRVEKIIAKGHGEKECKCLEAHYYNQPIKISAEKEKEFKGRE